MKLSACCNAPMTYSHTRLIMDPHTGDLSVVEICNCDECGNPCDFVEEVEEEEETDEDRAEQRGEYWMESERNGD